MIGAATYATYSTNPICKLHYGEIPCVKVAHTPSIKRIECMEEFLVKAIAQTAFFEIEIA